MCFFKLLFKISFFILFTSTILFSSEDKTKISFVIPRTVEDIFYRLVVDFTQIAANNMDIELNVIEADNNYRDVHTKVTKSFNIGNKTDAVITVSDRESGINILKNCEKYKIPFMIENASILDKSVGLPRENYKYYIGEMLPDDEKAGYLLAKYLISKSPVSSDGNIYLIAISGTFASSASFQREKGLYRALSEHPNVKLNQLVRANWSKDLAKLKTKVLKIRYPNTTVVWTASDGMAIGASLGIKQLNLESGKDVFIGGVDWSKDGVEAVKNGLIQVSAGGHFMETAWALITTYDYLKGEDFISSEGLNIKTDMSLITTDNIDEYKVLFDKSKWKNIDFKKFSKIHNKKLKKYNFNIDSVLSQLND